MKKTIPIPGEKQELKNALKEAQKKFGRLPEQEKQKIIKQVHKKAVRRARVIGMLAALGITTAVAGTKMLNSGKNNNPVVEQEEMTNAQKHSEFVNTYKQDIEPVKYAYVDDINNLKTQEEELAYIKKLYIEAMNEEMQYNTLTADDIQITYDYENYLYIDTNTGNLFTHGDYPDVTKQSLKDKYGINVIGFGDNEKVYKVKNKDGKIIDCASFQNIDGSDKPKLEKVYIGDGYENSKSILATMGTVIPSGISYYERFEDEGEKQNFIQSVKHWKETTKENSENEKEDNELEQ